MKSQLLKVSPFCVLLLIWPCIRVRHKWSTKHLPYCLKFTQTCGRTNRNHLCMLKTYTLTLMNELIYKLTLRIILILKHVNKKFCMKTVFKMFNNVNCIFKTIHVDSRYLNCSLPSRYDHLHSNLLIPKSKRLFDIGCYYFVFIWLYVYHFNDLLCILKPMNYILQGQIMRPI